MAMLELQTITLVFAVFIAVIALFYKWSRLYTRRRQFTAKKKIYACGEEMTPGRMNVPQESFYRVFIKSMKLEKLREWHSGDLGRYLMWVFTGMVVLMLYLLLFWGM